jgi:hypothetical protein
MKLIITEEERSRILGMHKNVMLNEQVPPKSQKQTPKTKGYKPLKGDRSFTFKDEASYSKFIDPNSYLGGPALMESAAFQFEDRYKMFGPYFMEMKEQVQGRGKVPTQKSDIEARTSQLINRIAELAAMMGITDLAKSIPDIETYERLAYQYESMNSDMFGSGAGPTWVLKSGGGISQLKNYWMNFITKVAQPIFNRVYQQYVLVSAQPQKP